MIHLTVQQLSASLDGALTGPSLELVVRHLAACHDCRDRQARLAKHDDALRRLLMSVGFRLGRSRLRFVRCQPRR